MAQRVVDFLDRTNELIYARIKSEATSNPFSGQSMAKAIARHLCLTPNAKRARPLVCLYYHWLFNNDIDDVIVPIGVAAEFIHAASLLHDDVVDDAHKRRGQTSANALFGNAQAVLAGNFLLTQAFDLLRGMKREFIEQAILVVREMTISAMLEIESRGKIDVSEDSWYRVAKGKTGILFSWCGWAAAINSKRELEAQQLWNLGFRIGNIFQMVDDLKDFSGDGNLKEVANDIRNKEASMPVLIAVNKDKNIKQQFQKKYLKDSLSDDDVSFLTELVLSSDAIFETKARISKELSQVQEYLSRHEGSCGYRALDEWIQDLACLSW
ncbi:MAG: polyprenyl synthetase family protein [Myxococcales bacterium]|nr:polyprenyl synthetase family protein [Myxococcales bacterium]USN50412.1 MAG: polyprenyl synthetase family protein [Myxococcales bacterium]